MRAEQEYIYTYAFRNRKKSVSSYLENLYSYNLILKIAIKNELSNLSTRIKIELYESISHDFQSYLD
jgi:hypothetical protein